MKPANPNETVTSSNRRGWQVAHGWPCSLLRSLNKPLGFRAVGSPTNRRRVDPMLTAWWMATDYRAAHSLALGRERRGRQRTRLRRR